MKRPKSIFVVVQAGVYRHDVGPYAFDLETAVERAKARQMLEADAHHDFEVLELVDGELTDGTCVATVTGVYERRTPTSANGWSGFNHTGEQKVEYPT